jgi:glycosyltransferase involved in cell wall biosynthesis
VCQHKIETVNDRILLNMTKRASISAIVLTKNSQNTIRNCLESVKWVDEIIIVDDCSIDSTVSICREYAHKIFERRLDSFSSQKNYGIEKASSDWILSIDSDEIVSDELKKQIRTLLCAEDALRYGYFVPFKNYVGKKWLRFGGLYPDYHLRLFKRGKGNFERPIHETVRITNTGYLSAPVIHHTYENYRDFYDKVKAYSARESRYLKETQAIPRFYYLRLFLEPLATFLYVYVKLQGFRDGFAGLVNAVFLSVYRWRLYYLMKN